MTSQTKQLLDKLNELEKLYDSACDEAQKLIDEADTKTSDETAREFDQIMRQVDVITGKIGRIGEVKSELARRIAHRRQTGI